MNEDANASASTDAAIRELMLLMPQLVGRAKRLPVPQELHSFALAPRHLTLLSHLLAFGPLTVTDLADSLHVAPTTVSLLIGGLAERGVIERHVDPADRRRRVIAISDAHRPAVERWLAPGARAWRQVLQPLAARDRALVVATLRAYLDAAARASAD